MRVAVLLASLVAAVVALPAGIQSGQVAVRADEQVAEPDFQIASEPDSMYSAVTAPPLSPSYRRTPNSIGKKRENEQVHEADFEITAEPDTKKRENEQVGEADFAIASEPDTKKRENEQVEEADFEIESETDD